MNYFKHLLFIGCLCLFLGLAVPAQCQSDLAGMKLRAEQGDVIAQFGLGAMYYHGTGVPQDYKQAFYWYEKAANQGNSDAQCALGMLYSDGEGVPRDKKRLLRCSNSLLTRVMLMLKQFLVLFILWAG